MTRIRFVSATLVAAVLAGTAVIAGPSPEPLKARRLTAGAFATPVAAKGRPAGFFDSWVVPPAATAMSGGEAQNCGAEGQRPCRIWERIPSCNTDLYEDFATDTCRHLPCGREGERACTFGERPFNSCDSNLVEIPGCVNCNGASGTCVRPTPCGGAGQRACLFAERPFQSCNEGLTEVPGCSGDCTANVDGARSIASCVKVPLQGIAEPTVNGTPAAAPACPVSGYADMHLHLFADLAHGGATLAGKPYDPVGGVNGSLWQDYTWNPGSHFENLLVKGGNRVPEPLLCPGYIADSSECGAGQQAFHLDHDIISGDSVGVGTKDGAQSNLGVPIFNGWPQWTSTTHQQAYFKWLERAWRGGLRMTTMLAVTNEALCRGGKTLEGTNCLDSMDSIRQQIDAAKAFEAWIAANHGGWFKIVYTPLDAREAIAAGKLAVVLGIETAELFNCKFPIDQCTLTDHLLKGIDNGFLASCQFSSETNGRGNGDGLPNCTPASIKAKVDEIYEMGVRHVFPVHNFDNAFGASAAWMSTIEVGNRVVEDHWWATRECKDEGYGLSIGGSLNALYKMFLSLVGLGTLTLGPAHPEEASCNALGLLPLGEVLITELMKKGMIVDVDHMSALAFDRTLEIVANPGSIADAQGNLLFPGRTTPYPVVASHVLSFDMHQQTKQHGLDKYGRHERMRTSDQLAKIKNVGGMIAAMLKDDVQDTDFKGWNVMNDYVSPRGYVANDCRHSSKSFAQAYQYAVDTMGGPVAFGSDFNGVAGHFGPRFGSEACGGWTSALDIEAADRRTERAKQIAAGNRLKYPFTLPGFGTFDKQVTGQKTFDYNTDGMAHVGLLPDFVADLKAIGLPPEHMEMIFRSAEAYIRVWEKSLGEDPPPGAPGCVAVTGVNAWPLPAYQNTPLFFTAQGTGLAGNTLSWSFGDGGSATGGLVSHSFNNAGTYVVRVSVTDQVSGTTSSAQTSIDVTSGNDTLFGPQIQISAPVEAFEGQPVPVSFSFARNILNPWEFVSAKCGATMPPPTGLRIEQEFFDTRATGSFECWYPAGSAAQTQQIEILVKKPQLFADPIFQNHAHSLRILNVAPQLGELPAQQRVQAGSTLVLRPTITHPAGGTLTLRVNWGDGTTPQTFAVTHGESPELEHLYPAPTPAANPHQVHIQLSDEAATVTHTMTVDVIGLDPTVSIDGPASIELPGEADFQVTAEDPDGGSVDLVEFSCGGAGQLLTALAPGERTFRCRFTELASTNPVYARVIDDEGATAEVTHGIAVVDTTPPRVTCGAADGQWHGANVSIACTATDDGAGLANAADTAFSLVTSVPAGTETTDAFTNSREVCDAAGNCATAAAIGGNKIDLKPPAVAVTRTPEPNDQGWNNVDVVATFTASDGGSGVADPFTIDVRFANDGAGQSATREFRDAVGNVASASIGGINIDKTPPLVTCSSSAPSLWPPNHRLVNVQFGVTVDDPLSGPAGFTLLSVTSNEPDNGLGDGDTPNDIQGFAIGTPDLTGQLRAERSGRGTGRVYSARYRAEDTAGNTTTCTTTSFVSSSQEKQ
jgi:microsomal dipeptidase-like Zn-dependent dipeptidase